MAENQFSNNPSDYIYDLGGTILTGLATTGIAVGSEPLLPATDSIEGSNGEVCHGAPAGSAEVVTIRALPGAGADIGLRRALRSGACQYFAVRRRGAAFSENIYFSDEVRVTGSSTGRINHSRDKEPIEYTLTVVQPIDNDLRNFI